MQDTGDGRDPLRPAVGSHSPMGEVHRRIVCPERRDQFSVLLIARLGRRERHQFLVVCIRVTLPHFSPYLRGVALTVGVSPLP